MLISRVPDEDGRKETRGLGDESENSQEYRTASELFEIMASNLNLHSDEEELHTTRDLVLIYKNIDLGTKLMSNANNDFRRKAPNQYVESVVYKDLDSDSELSEINSSEDIHNVMTINDKRINLLTASTSYENTFCHKIHELQLSSSNVTFDYDGKFVFNQPYLKDQLPYIQKKLTTLNPKDLVKPELPVSLLDYICCKRFEDHYNFDMDNIIRYVKLTIDQLKRISNGDYLTDKAKQKWREVDNVGMQNGEIAIQQTVLANTTSIPLHVEGKVTGNSTTWDDLVNSSIDIRSISKILEKKIIVEVPQTLCGTYKLFSRCCNDNLIISCKKYVQSEVTEEIPEEPRVNLVVKLNRSESGHVISKINSIIILKKSDNTCVPFLPYQSTETDSDRKCQEEKVTELQITKYEECNNDVKKQCNFFENNDNEMACSLPTVTSISPSESVSCDHSSQPIGSERQGSSSTSYEAGLREYEFESVSPFNNLHPDELCRNMRKLKMTALPEESPEDNSSSYKTKKRSPTRNRIKSPYENKSFVIEEKKRRRLLEIRQRREKNKLALSANESKVNKHKYPLPPLTSSSVTQLSITNKSFYNSIYGENMEIKPDKIKNRRETIPEISSNVDPDSAHLPSEVRELQSPKYVNKSHYLDNAVTEIMYLDMKNQDRCSETSSINDYKMDLKLLTPSDVSGKNVDITNTNLNTPRFIKENNKKKYEENLISPNVKHNNTPTNSPLVTETAPSESKLEEKDPKKASATAEFRKSIDKIYELINKLGKSDANDTKPCKSKFTAVERPPHNDGAGETSTVSDSGTSVKHQLTSSNPSYLSFENNSNVELIQTNKSPEALSSVPASKVIISSKSQNPKVENEKSEKGRKGVGYAGRQPNVENPLHAISQFLHEIDNVQKSRSRATSEKGRKPEANIADIKVANRSAARKGYTEQNRIDQNIEKLPKVITKERKKNTPLIMQPPIENRSTNIKKKVVDIVDEMKEARGEAVRGPSKLNSRLNSLAQPRKAYVQAQIEEFQERFGRSIVTDRLQRLRGSPSEQNLNAPNDISSRYRRRKICPETFTSLPKQSSNSQPAVLEKLQITKNKCNIVIPTIQNKLPSNQNQTTRASSANSLKKRIVELRNSPEKIAERRNSPEKVAERRHSPEKPSQIFSSKEFISNGKTRVPLIPNETEIASIVSSVDGSSTIGSRIRHMIDAIVPSPSVSQQNYKTKSKVINANLSEETAIDNGCEKPKTQKLLVDEKYSVDYHPERPLKIKRDHIIGDTIPEENDPPRENEVNVSSALKTVLFQRMSTGSFHKLIAKKSTHTQVLLLQSGDSNSMVLRSTISQNLKIANSKDHLNCLSDLTDLDWRFTPFPAQMPIVEYSFPIYDFQRPLPKPLEVNSLGNANNDSSISKNNISIQCYKGKPVDQFSEEVEVKVLKKIKSSPSVILEESEETKSESTVGNEKPELKELKEGQKRVLVQQTKPLKVDNTKDIALSLKTPESFIKSSEISIVKEKSKECENIVPTGQSSLMDYTNSLDVLVGLLDEIQNITTCQTQIANTDVNGTEEQLENMKTILKSAAALDNVQQEARNIISITSLDKLRQLDSNGSILSFYLSGDKDNVDNRFANFNLKPLHADKEVSAVIPLEFDNKCTDVPSRLFPLTLNHSTNVSSSLIGVLSQPSSRSLLTYNEYPLQSAASTTSLKRINLIKLPRKFEEDKADNMPFVVYKHNKQLREDNNRKFRSKKVTSYDDTDKQKFVICNKSLKVESDFDPVMKMKRDILVTMYSVLVLTVFAALSFPEILYRA